jgi:hypothetical protein
MNKTFQINGKSMAKSMLFLENQKSRVFNDLKTLNNNFLTFKDIADINLISFASDLSSQINDKNV